MSEPESKSGPSGTAVWTWTLAIFCLVSGALFFPTPLPFGMPLMSLGLLILAPRLPWARRKFIGLMESYPRVAGRLLANPPPWLERRLAEAGISLPASVASQPSAPPSSDGGPAENGEDSTRAAENGPRPRAESPTSAPSVRSA